MTKQYNEQHNTIQLNGYRPGIDWSRYAHNDVHRPMANQASVALKDEIGGP